MHRQAAYLVAAVVLIIAGGAGVLPRVLGGPSASSAAARSERSRPARGAYPISHIVFIIQENRSVDNFFQGFPGADTVSSAIDRFGNRVKLAPMPLNGGLDTMHTHHAFLREFDSGRMDGFDRIKMNRGGKLVPAGNLAYSYVPRDEIRPYWQMASDYALSDETFQSNAGPSFPAHLYLIAGQSAHIGDNPNKRPWGCDGGPDERARAIDPRSGDESRLGIWPCLSPYQLPVTLSDELDRAGLTWRYYAPGPGNIGFSWSVFDAVQAVRFGPEWNSNVIAPETRVLSDLAAGTLANVTWVVPASKNSDHAFDCGPNGPNWVASVVDAVGRSRYWQDTAIFVTWDDWGGWYDHVRPPQLDYEGLGFRVPLLAISPYARRGFVSHVPHESSSLLSFAEEVFDLPPMAAADMRATPLDDLFDFAAPPARRPFQPIALTAPLADVLRDSHQSTGPPDGGITENESERSERAAGTSLSR